MKFTQSENCPSWHISQMGVIPRGAHESQGFRTTRWPGRSVVTAGPTRWIVPTTSCPITCGNDVSVASGLSMPSKSMKTCL